MTTTIPASRLEDELRSRIHEWVHPGFGTREEVIEWANDWVEDEPEAPGPAHVERLVDEAWSRRLAELGSGRRSTDPYARLAAAFIALEADGVVGRMDYTCCTDCGRMEIRKDPEAEAARGYVLFSQQDTGRIVTGVLHLTYGSLRADAAVGDALLAAAKAGQDSEERQAARREVMRRTDAHVAAQVLDALRAHGLDASWDGDVDQRIRVDVRGWRKPLPTG